MMADDMEEDLDVEGVDEDGPLSLGLGIDPNELPSSSTQLSPELSQHPWLTFDDQFNSHIPDVVLHDDIDESSRITINQMIQEEHTYLQKNKFMRYQSKGQKTPPKKEERPASHNTRWTEKEKEIFKKGIEQLGHRWKEIADLIQTRTHTQVKSYARSFLLSKAASCDSSQPVGSSKQSKRSPPAQVPQQDGGKQQCAKQERETGVCMEEEDVNTDAPSSGVGDEMKRKEEEEDEEEDVEIDVEDDSEDECRESGCLQSAQLFGDILRNDGQVAPNDSPICDEGPHSSGIDSSNNNSSNNSFSTSSTSKVPSDSPTIANSPGTSSPLAKASDVTETSDDNKTSSSWQTADSFISAYKKSDSISISNEEPNHLGISDKSLKSSIVTKTSNDDDVDDAISMQPGSESEGLSLPLRILSNEETLQIDHENVLKNNEPKSNTLKMDHESALAQIEPKGKKLQVNCKTTQGNDELSYPVIFGAKTESSDDTDTDGDELLESGKSQRENRKSQLKDDSSQIAKKGAVECTMSKGDSEPEENEKIAHVHRETQGKSSRRRFSEGIENDSDSSVGDSTLAICPPSREKGTSHRGRRGKGMQTGASRGRRNKSVAEDVVPEDSVSHCAGTPSSANDTVNTETTLASELPGNYDHSYAAISSTSDESHDPVDVIRSCDLSGSNGSHNHTVASHIGSCTEKSKTRMVSDYQGTTQNRTTETCHSSLVGDGRRHEMSRPTSPKSRTGIGDEKDIGTKSDVNDMMGDVDISRAGDEEEEGEEKEEKQKKRGEKNKEKEDEETEKMKEREENEGEEEEKEDGEKQEEEDSADERSAPSDDEDDSASDKMEESTPEDDTEPPKEEVFLDVAQVTEEEKAAHPEFFDYKSAIKTPERYLVIRNHIIKCWQKTKPAYLNKTSVRSGLSNGGDVNAIGLIHTYLESIGAINFGASNPFYSRLKKRRRTTHEKWAQYVPEQERKRPKREIKPPKADIESKPSSTRSTEEKPKKPKPRQPKAHVYDPFKLVECSSFSAELQAPFDVRVKGDVIVTMDLHAHLSTTEVIGLLGGHFDSENSVLDVRLARPCRSLSTGMQCEMDPVSQTEACEEIMLAGCCVVGWYHSHPTFSPNPSIRDIETQQNFQEWFSQDARTPFIGVIVSPYHNRQSAVSKINYLTISKEWAQEHQSWRPFKFDVSVYHERTTDQSHQQIITCATTLIAEFAQYKYRVEMLWVCPGQSGITYLEKMLQSISSNLCGDEEEKKEIVSKLRQMIFDQFGAKCSNVIKDATLDVPLSFDSCP